MRKAVDHQLTFGETDISQIKFDLKSRDDIPPLLKGLQYIYTQKETREEIFQILEKEVAPNTNKRNGRPGMDLWKIFVMGTLRLNLNWDYLGFKLLSEHSCEIISRLPIPMNVIGFLKVILPFFY